MQALRIVSLFFAASLGWACGSSSEPDGPGGTGGTGSGGGGGSDGTGGEGGSQTRHPLFVDPSWVARQPRIATPRNGGCVAEGSVLVCWGGNADGAWSFPSYDAVTVSAKSNDLCLQASNGQGVCFNDGPGGLTRELGRSDQAAVRLGLYANFGIGSQGQLEGSFRETKLVVPTTPFSDVTSTLQIGCGIGLEDGHIECWKLEPDREDATGCETTPGVHGEFESPEGQFVQIVAGQHHFCALDARNLVTCWGAGDGSTPDCPDGPAHHQQSGPPRDEFSFIAAGDYHSCGVKLDGTIVCWGAGEVKGSCGEELDCGQAAPPSGSNFVQVACGYTHSCGLRTDGKVACWGSDTFGRSTPPVELQP